MKMVKNERGYMLIIVLMTVLLITTFALVLIPKAISTMKQVGVSETSTHTKQMAEMGVEYAFTFIESQVNLAIQDVKEITAIDQTVNHDKVFCERIRTRLNSTPLNKDVKMTGNENYSFQVKYSAEPRTIESKDNTNCEGFKKITIPVDSTGKIEGQGTKLLKAYYVVNNKGAILSTEPTPGAPKTPVDPNILVLNPVYGIIDLSGNNVSELYRSAKITNMVTIRGNGRLQIAGNAWFDGGGANYQASIDFKGNNGIVTVSGDAFFKYPVSLGGKGTNYICIKGNAYIYNPKTLTWDPYPTVKEEAACPNKPEVQTRVDYYYDYNLWENSRSSLDVQY